MVKKVLPFVALLLLLLPSAITMASSSPPNESVIDPALHFRLSQADDDDEIEVIIQFKESIQERDLAFLRSRGFTIFKTFDIMPVVYAQGEKRMVHELSNYERTWWIEYNAPMKYYMNQTKDTILAEDVWLSQIRDGKEVGMPITGAGVTVVVLDSGIDGTHPDLDYSPVDIEGGEAPQPGQKVIMNVKKDQDIAGEPFIPFKNTDTSSGHGTHCAGTVAGTGDASAGRITGIAPDAWLIGVSMGEGIATIDEFSGLVWVYEHSEPGNNPANIRVVTNSWGPGYPFDSLDPNDASSGVINQLVHDNNVAVVFAAGNDGASNHDGQTDTVNIFAKVPAAIGVAASTRNGTGMAGFSSRGDKEKVETWPDITAPGVNIWSAAARATLIGAAIGLQDLTRDENDPYYLAISGTSMATPHVAGLVALLWEACPSMTMSNTNEDYDGDLPIEVDDNSGNFEGGPYYFDDARIHESELILKLTSDFIEPLGSNGVPTGNGSTRQGLDDRVFDYAQGYGLVNARKAVALALKLQYMRDPDGDGILDNPEVTVWDAYNRSYQKTMESGMYSKETDMISHSWHGKFVDSDSMLAEDVPFYENTVPRSNIEHKVFIPEDSLELKITFTYKPRHIEYVDPTDIPEGSWSYLVFTIDVDDDGTYEYPFSDVHIPDLDALLSMEETVVVEYTVNFAQGPWEQNMGRNWTFDVIGYAMGVGTIGKGARNEFTFDLLFRLDADERPRVPYDYFTFEEPSSQYYNGKVYLEQNWFILKEKPDTDDDFKISTEVGISMVLLIVIGLTGGWLFVRRKFELDITDDE